MNIYLNILVIMFAVIGFLILYYTTLRKDRKNQDYQLPFRKRKTEFEVGEEIGVDKKIMKKSEESISEEREKKDNSSFTEEKNKTIYNLKENYNKNFIRLLNRDPSYLFTYWEINEDKFYKNTPVLRLFNLQENKYNDIKINHHSRNWYLRSLPDSLYKISIGYIKEGVFYPLASSKNVQTPLDHPSNIIDEHWMTIEELSHYSFRIEMDTLAMMKNIEGRKIQEELEANSLTIIQK